MTPKFYVTTAIDYVNGKPHLGHAYEKIGTDVIARYKRRMGFDVHFLTGLDEHGLKVARTAEAAGKTPQEFVDELAAHFIEAYQRLDISYDDLIRTSEPRHAQGVVEMMERVREHNPDDLYEGSYEGWYCVGCEGYKTDKDLTDGICPDHPNLEPSWIEEKNLFFRLSRYQEFLAGHIAEHPEFIQPSSRRNEILSVIEGGLADISVSRPNLPWGIPIPFHPGSTVYVWFDALSNYITALGFGSDDTTKVDRYWPADLHVIGKDITRFHCIIWPAMLAAAGLPLPKTVHAHGFVTSSGLKQSKTLGNVVEPLDAVEKVGADPLRYYLMAEITYGKDGDFSWERFESSYNTKLANEYGNLISRSLNMTKKYFGEIPAASDIDEVREVVARCVDAYVEAMDGYHIDKAIRQAREIVGFLNGLIQEREPFRMAKSEDPAVRQELSDLMYAIDEAIRIATNLLWPVMPTKCGEVLQRLGCEADLDVLLTEACGWGRLRPGSPVEKGPALFPRLG
jgi:methionyl-tRNA synthetase